MDLPDDIFYNTLRAVNNPLKAFELLELSGRDCNTTAFLDLCDYYNIPHPMSAITQVKLSTLKDKHFRCMNAIETGQISYIFKNLDSCKEEHVLKAIERKQFRIAELIICHGKVEIASVLESIIRNGDLQLFKRVMVIKPNTLSMVIRPNTLSIWCHNRAGGGMSTYLHILSPTSQLDIFRYMLENFDFNLDADHYRYLDSERSDLLTKHISARTDLELYLKRYAQCERSIRLRLELFHVDQKEIREMLIRSFNNHQGTLSDFLVSKIDPEVRRRILYHWTDQHLHYRTFMLWNSGCTNRCYGMEDIDGPDKLWYFPLEDLKRER